MTELICIGVPYWLGSKADYTGSVEVLQASGIADELQAEWIDIAPDFDAVPDPLIAVNRALAEAIQAHADKVPFIFAGDCTSCLGAVRGLSSQDPAIVWFDAHGDFNTPETTLSGFLGGMPLAALVGKGNQHWLEGVGLKPLAERDVIITDVRDLDPAEAELLHHSDVIVLKNVADLLTLDLPQKPIYIHFDTDITHLEDLPAVSYPATGGPHVDDILPTLTRLGRSGNIAGVLFTLWNNSLPGAEKSMQTTRRYITALAEALQMR
ncbi:MAG: arginase family protein [Anaerolineae bacterium]|nr:arginase family protein [Anaerolineae bacterium]